jgi:hypothetical protein
LSTPTSGDVSCGTGGDIMAGIFRLAAVGQTRPESPPGRHICMHRLTAEAGLILERMETGRRYETDDLRAFLPRAGMERLRELMHELWLNRRVERVGHTGWRRHQSAPPHASAAVPRDTEAVTPEELFDHAAFADFFK